MIEQLKNEIGEGYGVLYEDTCYLMRQETTKLAKIKKLPTVTKIIEFVKYIFLSIITISIYYFMDKGVQPKKEEVENKIIADWQERKRGRIELLVPLVEKDLQDLQSKNINLRIIEAQVAKTEANACKIEVENAQLLVKRIQENLKKLEIGEFPKDAMHSNSLEEEAEAEALQKLAKAKERAKQQEETAEKLLTSLQEYIDQVNQMESNLSIIDSIQRALNS